MIGCCTVHPQFDPDPYSVTAILHPALPAVLPGQPNPFAWTLLLSKAWAEVGEIQLVSWSHTPPAGRDYAPLTVLEARREDQAVLGRVRNDSGRPLQDARVVVYSDNCGWRPAVVDSPALPAGEEAVFRVEAFYCAGEEVQVVGQGSFGP